VDLLASAARTGETGDGTVLAVTVDSVMRMRNGDPAEDAV
jgi:nitrogen regulatory protein PII